MVGLSTFQTGPKWPKTVRNGQPRYFWSFGTLFGPSEPFWTISNKKWFFAQKHLRQTLLCPYGATNWFLSKIVQKDPDGPKRVPNCQKHLGLPFQTLLDPFGPLQNVEKPAMFGHFCLFYWCVFLGHPVIFLFYTTFITSLFVSKTSALESIPGRADRGVQGGDQPSWNHLLLLQPWP